MLRPVILIFSIAILSVIDSCKKDVQFQQQGLLEGPDYALCACCGGVILKIGSNSNNRIDSLPGMTNQELYNLTFPKTIRFNSVLKSQCGNFNYLTITSFKFTD